MYKLTVTWCACLVLAFGFTACQDEKKDTDLSGDYSSVLTKVSEDVILANYQNLADKAQALQIAVHNLKDAQNGSTFEAVQKAWKEARAPWEQSESFLFGPVDTKGIDPALDSWPIALSDINQVLQSSNTLDAAYIESLDGSFKGFHTIEFLLFGTDSQKDIQALTARELEYLVALSDVLAKDTQRLIDAWKPTGENFVANLLQAGDKSSVYNSQKVALQELAQGCVNIADELANAKIKEPLDTEDVTLEESQFSHNTKNDFINNLKSIELVYLGTNSNGLTSIVQSKDSALDNQIKSELKAAQDAVNAIPGTFTDAIPNGSPSKAAARKAEAAVTTLFGTLENKLLPLVSTL